MFEFNKKLVLKEASLDVLTVGELLVDMISADYDDNFKSSSYQRFFGGSPANIAMNVKKLGISSAVAAAVGMDGLGDFLIQCMEEAHLATDLIQRVEYATSMVLLTKSKSSPVPVFYRDADFQLEYSSGLDTALRNSRIVHFSCWPISRKPSRILVEKLLEEAKSYGTLVGFDPNYHPMLWEKREDGVEYIKSVISRVDIVKPSEDDAERLFGSASPEKQMERFLRLGAKLVILTLGSDGALVSNGVEMLKLDTMASEVVDTTGAGDAFWSGFYAAVSRGYTLVNALKAGLAVSAYKLKYTGAVVNLPDLETIEKMYGIQFTVRN